MTNMRIVLVFAAIGVVFAGSFAYARANAVPGSSTTASAAGAPGLGAAAGGAACAGCGGSGQESAGATVVDGDVQRIDIAIDGDYLPNVVTAKAGVPIEITFAQADGCFEEVVFPDFGIRENLTQGPVTITLPALEPGEYGWSCGMQMAFGRIVVEG